MATERDSGARRILVLSSTFPNRTDRLDGRSCGRLATW